MSRVNDVRVKKIFTAKRTPNAVQKRDTFETPRYAVEMLIPFLQKDWEVWEVAVGGGMIRTVLEDGGFRVVGSDIRQTPSVDFLYNFATDEKLPDISFDVIVTNPPFSIKDMFVERALEIGKPFAFLINADYSKRTIDWVRHYGCQRIIPTFRINYITPNLVGRVNEAEGTNFTSVFDVSAKLLYKHTSSQFHSMWLTWGLNLPSSEVFVDMPVEYRKQSILPKRRIDTMLKDPEPVQLTLDEQLYAYQVDDDDQSDTETPEGETSSDEQ